MYKISKIVCIIISADDINVYIILKLILMFSLFFYTFRLKILGIAQNQR
jgi:hypothetical protein